MFTAITKVMTALGQLIYGQLASAQLGQPARSEVSRRTGESCFQTEQKTHTILCRVNTSTIDELSLIHI